MTSQSPSGVDVAHISAWYRKRQVLHDISFTAPRGAVTAIIGPNGSGKTTLLKAIAGLTPFKGRATVDGRPVANHRRSGPASKVGYVPQRTLLETPFTVERVVSLGRFAERSPFAPLTPDDRAAVDDALVRSSTLALRNRDFTTLSGGERQRVLLARALATGATTLLLDEPTSAQDIGMGLVMAKTLRELASRGATVLVVLHNLAETRQMADQAVLLERGRIQYQGTALDVTQPVPIRQTFGVDVVEGGSLALRLTEEPLQPEGQSL